VTQNFYSAAIPAISFTWMSNTFLLPYQGQVIIFFTFVISVITQLRIQKTSSSRSRSDKKLRIHADPDPHYLISNVSVLKILFCIPGDYRWFKFCQRTGVES
jgi:hypothetical protein